jgi:hypothetical protein
VSFVRELQARNSSPTGRRFVFVPYDQLTDRVGPLSRLGPTEAGIVLVESPEKASRRPYHRQKLLTVLANLRHFALEQAERGRDLRSLSSELGKGADPGEDRWGWLARRLVQEELISESDDGTQRLRLRSSGRCYLRSPWPLHWAA